MGPGRELTMRLYVYITFYFKYHVIKIMSEV